MNWLFALKYWIIAREVPKLFEGRQIQFSERTYNWINWIGIMLNFIPCGLLAYFRARVTMDSVDGASVSTSLANTTTVVYYTITGLELVSALILADALRRIRSSLKYNPFLFADQKTMVLHVVMLMTHTVVLTVSAFFVFRAFQDPYNEEYQTEQQISRICLAVSLCIQQSIMIYLFTKFRAMDEPSEQKVILKDSTAGDSTEHAFDSSAE